MKLIKIILAMIAMILLFAVSLQASDNLYSPKVPDHYIVVLNDNLDKSLPETANEMARMHGLAIGHIYSHTIKGFSAYIPEKRVEILKSDPRVKLIDPDFIVSAFDHPDMKAKPGTTVPPPQPGQTLPTGIDRIDAELNQASGPFNIGVAVLDTGIDLDHRDLNVAGGVSFIRTRSGPDDDNGHGTHVAGIIAAMDNEIGVVGVIPGASLYAVKVLDKNGSGTWSGVIAGIEWVTANSESKQIKVANMSLGGSGSDVDSSLRQAINASVSKGITYVVAAGNDASDAKNSVPAAYDSVITISAIVDTDGKPGGTGPYTSYGLDDTFASFSNFGEDVDIAAPGVNILSTWKGGAYKTISGTSMATPHVAGAAALYIFNNPGATPSAVRDALVLQGDFDGFTGDPDIFNEPLLNAAGL